MVEWVATICSSLLNIFSALNSTIGEFLTSPIQVLVGIVDSDIAQLLSGLIGGLIDVLFRNVLTGAPLTMLEFMYFSLGLYIAYQFIIWVLNLIT